MFKLLVATLTTCVLSFTSAFAENTDADVLASYEQAAEVSAMGTCDGMRSTLVHFTGTDDKTDYKMEMFIPVTNSHLRFYVVVKESDNEYFIKRFKDDDPPEVQKLSPMDWSMELMSNSMNFYYAHFFPELDHDCTVAPLK